MSAARQHADWLSLVETSGPFLSMPVLVRTFPQGLEKPDDEADRSRTLAAAYEEWEDSQEGRRPDPALHTAWVRFVLNSVLDLPSEVVADGQRIPPGLRVTVAEHGETLVPDIAVVNPSGDADAGKPRLLVQVYPAAQDLRRTVAGARWKASPETRMVELLRGTGVRLGLVTNGEQWMLISSRPGEPAGFASWYASLWLEEPLTLRAFVSLLGVRRFFGVAQSETLEALLDESARDQQEVTDQLGWQVRRAVEVLVAALDRADRERGRGLLVDIPEERLYEAAVTVMMRLVFLFAAEERGLLLLGDPLYDEHYAVSTLRTRLREAADQHTEDVLEYRTDAWCRLLATSRAVHGGVRHDRLTLPAYGGSLFDPDRFPFLEGRAARTSWRNILATPVPVNNRTVLHLLEALQLLEVRVPGGGPAEARRLSFVALDIEQIGHVYEGLLDHTAARATSPVIGLQGPRTNETEVMLDDLERLAADGDTKLIDFLAEETGRQPTSIRKALTYEPVGDHAHRWLVACDNDARLERRVRRFAGLVREDTRGYPVVIAPGCVYVTRGSDRRTTGTHYTPRSLTEPIVRYTLEPLVYDGPAEGKPREEWRLKAARELLALRVCDMAMGSGAFLVESCRFLSQRLVEAWEEAERQHPGAPGITPEGGISTGAPEERLIPKDTEERLALARRLVADRCLYGVDRNPMAVEMAKLSLWLVTLQKDRPFTFLDHALKCGDSLLGVTSIDQIEWLHINPDKGEAGHQFQLWASVYAPALRAAIDKRRRLESFPVEAIADAQEKARLLSEAEMGLADVRLIGDLIIGAALSTAGKKASALDARLEQIGDEVFKALDPSTAPEVRAARVLQLAVLARTVLGASPSGIPRTPFHWPVEFPEVFQADDRQSAGFDAIVGNPPFQGGQKITGALGTDYRHYLVEQLAGGRRGSADLCAYFFLRAHELLRDGGGFGMLATNTIAQGDTREVGLERLTENGAEILRAIPSRKWPGEANLEIAEVWARRGGWRGECALDDRPVSGITAFLTRPAAVTGKPYRLAANASKSFQGSIVLGMGFVLSPEEAEALIARDSWNRDVLFPYLNGEDLNTRPDQSPSRWVINFRDWPLRRGARGRWTTASDEERVAWLRSGVVPDDYPDPVAADYPDCLKIVEEKVKPERDTNKRKVRRERWWQFAERAPELYATIARMDRVLVRSRVAEMHSVAIASASIVLNERLTVFAFSGIAHLALLQSTIHELWAREYASTLRRDMMYAPVDCFETFPIHESTDRLAVIGERYHAHRQSLMLARDEGLTKTYNRFHDLAETAADILQLRDFHVEMDRTVAAAYGWADLDLDHGFHATKQGLRFTTSEPARQEVLARLLRLNHERYADEVRRGLHDRNKRRTRAGSESGSEDLFGGA